MLRDLMDIEFTECVIGECYIAVSEPDCVGDHMSLVEGIGLSEEFCGGAYGNHGIRVRAVWAAGVTVSSCAWPKCFSVVVRRVV